MGTSSAGRAPGCPSLPAHSGFLLGGRFALTPCPHRAAAGGVCVAQSHGAMATAVPLRACTRVRRGFPVGRNELCEVSAPRAGHNATLLLDGRTRAPRRHLPGSAWTGASSRGQGSGSCFQPGTGHGLRQVSGGPGEAGAGGKGTPASREPPDRHSPRRAPRGLDMSAQEAPQGRRFPIEAGDSPGLAAAAPESQDSPEPVATEHNPVR